MSRTILIIFDCTLLIYFSFSESSQVENVSVYFFVVFVSQFVTSIDYFKKMHLIIYLNLRSEKLLENINIYVIKHV